jgi:superfamily II DNA or RNA helicase
VQVVVVDELHEQLARKNFDVMHTINPLARYGLTATLKLSKKEIRLKAHSFAGPVIFRFSIQEGIERDVLTKGRCIQLLFPSQSDSNSDYLLDYASQVTGNKDKLNTVTALVSSLVLMDRYVLVLTEHVKHMLAISESAASIPIPHGVAHGEIDKSARKNDRNLFESGHIRLLISTAVYRKGVTLKRLDVVIDTAEKPDQNAAVQKFGRGLGKHKDKTDLLYIDIGTYGDFRFSKAARSRSKALKAIGVEVISRRVRTVNDALKAVREFIAEPEQLSLLGS